MILRIRIVLVALAVVGLVAVVLAAAGSGLVARSAGDRTISLYNIHTKETLTVQYMTGGRRIPEAMDKIDWMLRDWRRDEKTRMDPGLVDLIWEIHAELGSREPVHIISGYRSRGTNEMLRKSVGGQASESRHILGKAADIHFPDIPLKQMRYSALIREKGGVGYYPTSAIPFVHVDTDRVRHWPRLPRYELALLFPDGRTQHQPADGGAITREDVRIAQAKHRDVASQIAAFFDLRRTPGTGTGTTPGTGSGTIAVADAGRAAAPSPSSGSSGPSTHSGSREPARAVVAALGPPMSSSVATPVSAPLLVVPPRLVERPSRFASGGPSVEERQRLSQLFTLAALAPAEAEPQLVAGPAPVRRPAKPRAALPAGPDLAGEGLPAPPAEATREAAASVAAGHRPGWGSGWARAPDFDEDHPEELSYRPFPLAPMLTASASADDPVLAGMVHPDVARTVDMIDQGGNIPPLSFRPGAQVAQLLWAQQFQGQAVVGLSLPTSADRIAAAGVASGVAARRVRTATQ